MLDLSLAEIVLVVVVAAVFIGPKELPVVIRALAKGMRSVRSLGREVMQAFDELARESGVKETADDIKQQVRLIEGDDGKLYESYDIPHIQPPSHGK